jgi:3',5'-cyclic AMP phosphodiesterase CpdA
MLLAQLTDLHIKPRGRLAYDQVDTATALATVVAHLGRLNPAPDAVIATGDLVDAGQADEYEFLRELLAPLTQPVFLLPGNHDLRGPLRAVFHDHRYLGTDGPIRYTVETLPVRLVVLDSVVEYQPHGVVDPLQLDWLDRQLEAAPGRPTIVALHHPPFKTGLAFMDRIRLSNGPDLAAVIRRHPQVERVLCGHLHRPIQTRWAGTLASTGPSTAHQLSLALNPDTPPAFRLEPLGYQLHLYTPEDGLVSHTVSVGDWPGPYPFFAANELIE